MIRNRVLSSTVGQGKREYDLIPASFPLIEFFLRIRTGKPGTKAFRDELYAVQSDPEAPDDIFAFWLLKDSGIPGEDDIYWVWFPADFDVTSSDGLPPIQGRCNCYAGNKHGHCKHRDALQDAVQLSFGCVQTQG